MHVWVGTMSIIVQEVIDTTLIDIEVLDNTPINSETKNNLISDAVFYLKSNARKKILNAELEDKILEMKKGMEKNV